jgi:hypothetical protein
MGYAEKRANRIKVTEKVRRYAKSEWIDSIVPGVSSALAIGIMQLLLRAAGTNCVSVSIQIRRHSGIRM